MNTTVNIIHLLSAGNKNNKKQSINIAVIIKAVIFLTRK